MAKAIPSDATRLFDSAIAMTTPGISQFRHFHVEQCKLDRLLELRSEIDALRTRNRERRPPRSAYTFND